MAYLEAPLQIPAQAQDFLVRAPSAAYTSKSQHDRRENGVAYTPAFLGKYLADKVARYLAEDWSKKRPSDTNLLSAQRILDPACGNGELLVAAWQALLAHHGGLQSGEIPHATEALCGIDIDRRALRETVTRISRLERSGSRREPKLLQLNALAPRARMAFKDAWSNLLVKFDAPLGFDIVIANPPWGANTDDYINKLDREFFSLLRGQFDTSDLFFELALSVVKPGGYLAFIVPDSLFSHEREGLRRLLLTQTQLRFVARLGEKFFARINRACVLVICKKIDPDQSQSVQCVRLAPGMRKEILAGRRTLQEVEDEASNWMPQKRFMSNTQCAFDIDISPREEQVVDRLKRLPKIIGDYLWNGRGIELSKSGKVVQCKSCKGWMPKPSKLIVKCSHCALSVTSSTAISKVIVSKTRVAGFVPLLVGEHVCRYLAQTPNWIEPGIRGINYKAKSLYKGPKLLVRKTGVGISAAIDYSNSFVTQVVYIFGVSATAKHLPLELFLAILNSRAMYFFVAKQHGETEWRSHPYLTQSQVLQLPLPDFSNPTQEQLARIHEIVRLLRPILVERKPVPVEMDAKVELHVASLLGLTKIDYEIIYRTLDTVEDLLPVRALRTVSLDQLF